MWWLGFFVSCGHTPLPAAIWHRQGMARDVGSTGLIVFLSMHPSRPTRLAHICPCKAHWHADTVCCRLSLLFCPTPAAGQTLTGIRPRRKRRGSGVTGVGAGVAPDEASDTTTATTAAPAPMAVEGDVRDVVGNAPFALACSLTSDTGAGISAKGSLFLWSKCGRKRGQGGSSCVCVHGGPRLPTEISSSWLTRAWGRGCARQNGCP